MSVNNETYRQYQEGNLILVEKLFHYKKECTNGEYEYRCTVAVVPGKAVIQRINAD